MKVASGKNSSSVFERLGRGPLPQQTKTCIYWLKGQCTKRNCRYMHATPSAAAPKAKQFLAPQAKQLLSNHLAPSDVNRSKRLSSNTWKNEDCKQPIGGNNGSPQEGPRKRRLNRSSFATNVAKGPSSSDLLETRKPETVGREDPTDLKDCSVSSEVTEQSTSPVKEGSVNSEVTEQCTSPVKEGSSVSSIKSESSQSSGLRQLAKLKGHNKTITGIALPCDSSTLYTASKDNCLRAWDCHTGQCTGTECLDGEVRCIITKGPWIFAGLPNIVKAWNPQDKVKCNLNAIGGQVHSLEFDNGILFAGMENGDILVWRWNNAANDFEQATTLNGHSSPVHSLVIGAGHGKLYSASADSSIKVWDQTLQCVQTIDGHTKEVTSLVCWDRYMLSTSLDNTLKIWGAAESGSMELVYKHEVDQGITALSILDKPEVHHILLSLEDKSLRLYDFPSFAEKGRVCSEEQSVVTQSSGIHGLFFTGDAAGDVSVWELSCRN